MNLPPHQIIEEQATADEKSLVIELTINASMPCFEGHFEGHPIMPAVAQLHVVQMLAKKHFTWLKQAMGMRRLKFSSPIQPDAVIRLDMTAGSDRLTFRLSSHEQTHSQGVILYGAES